MKFKRCRLKCNLLIAVIAMCLSIVPANTLIAAGRIHQDGTIYCVVASEVEITSIELKDAKELGNLENLIVDRSKPLIRLLESMETYTGGFGKLDLMELLDLEFDPTVTDIIDVVVVMIVNPEKPEEGSIKIPVKVIYKEEEPKPEPNPEPEPEPDVPGVEPESPIPPPVIPPAGKPEEPNVPNTPNTPNSSKAPKEKTKSINETPYVDTQTETDIETDVDTEEAQEVSEKPKEVQQGKTVEEDIAVFTKIDALAVGLSLISFAAYSGMLYSDFKLIRWFGKKKRENMRRFRK